MTSSAYSAASGLWVTATMVKPSFLLRFLSNSIINFVFSVSSSPVGSSASKRAGLFARARAIATLCCSPPESCF